MRRAKDSSWKPALLTVLLLAVLAVVYTAFVRPWHAGWGATEAEQRMALPGDSLAINPAAVTTRALTIHAPPEVVWHATVAGVIVLLLHWGLWSAGLLSWSSLLSSTYLFWLGAPALIYLAAAYRAGLMGERVSR